MKKMLMMCDIVYDNLYKNGDCMLIIPYRTYLILLIHRFLSLSPPLLLLLRWSLRFHDTWLDTF